MKMKQKIGWLRFRNSLRNVSGVRSSVWKQKRRWINGCWISSKKSLK